MPNSWRRGVYDRVEYVVVERNGVKEERQLGRPEVEAPTTTISQLLRGSYTKRQAPSPTEADDDSDDDDDDNESQSMTFQSATTTASLNAAPSAVRASKALERLKLTCTVLHHNDSGR